MTPFERGAIRGFFLGWATAIPLMAVIAGLFIDWHIGVYMLLGFCSGAAAMAYRVFITIQPEPDDINELIDQMIAEWEREDQTS